MFALCNLATMLCSFVACARTRSVILRCNAPHKYSYTCDRERSGGVVRVYTVNTGMQRSLALGNNVIITENSYTAEHGV